MYLILSRNLTTSRLFYARFQSWCRQVSVQTRLIEISMPAYTSEVPWRNREVVKEVYVELLGSLADMCYDIMVRVEERNRKPMSWQLPDEP
jgi:hypothetical protein